MQRNIYTKRKRPFFVRVFPLLVSICSILGFLYYLYGDLLSDYWFHIASITNSSTNPKFLKRSANEIESSIIKKTENEYGLYRTTPVWGELLVPFALVSYKDLFYVGEWDFILKVPHGTGISYDKHLDEKYSGNFKFGKKHGLGRVIFSCGDLYEGEFFEGEIHGNGTLLYIQGKVYIGEFVKGVKEGFGKEQDRHETCYEGEYLNDKRSGHGKLIWADGRVYIGEFLDDKMHGFGEYLWPDGRKYYGQWEKDKMHGEGNLLWDDGREYSGQYYKGLEDGNGKMLFANGDIYDGMWRDGKQHGIGILYKAEGENKGEWKNGNFIRWLDN